MSAPEHDYHLEALARWFIGGDLWEWDAPAPLAYWDEWQRRGWVDKYGKLTPLGETKVPDGEALALAVRLAAAGDDDAALGGLGEAMETARADGAHARQSVRVILDGLHRRPVA